VNNFDLMSVNSQLSEKILIKGGRPLLGSVSPDGAKNSSLYALIASTFIKDGWMTLENIPNITDIDMSLKILEELGMSYQVDQSSLKIYGQVKKSNISDHTLPKFDLQQLFLALY